MEARSSHRLPLYATIAADSVSRVGNTVTITAVPWFVLVTTGSASKTGVVVFVNAVAVVISLLFGGVLVDRTGYWRSSIVADAMSGVTVAMIPLLFHTIGLEFWQLLILTFLGALLDIPAQVARYSSLPDLSRDAGMRFERANAILEGLITGTSLAGPALAGVLIALIDASNVLWLDAMTFLISIALMATLVPGQARPTEPRTTNYGQDFVESLRFIRGEQVLFALVLFFAVMNILIGPIDTVIVPVYAKEVFDSSVALGIMAAGIGVGSLVGNVIFGWFGHRLSRRAVFFASFISTPICLGALAFLPGMPLTVTILVLLGLGLSLANMLEYTIYFERIPANMRARVLGVTGALGWFSVPIGRLMGGFLIEWVGLSQALTAMAIIFLPAPFAMFAVRAFRNLGPPETGNDHVETPRRGVSNP